MKINRRTVFVVAFLLSLLVSPPTIRPQTPPMRKDVGPAVGQMIPVFKARDQFGREQTVASLMGPQRISSLIRSLR